jgi:hypothetical protein
MFYRHKFEADNVGFHYILEHNFPKSKSNLLYDALIYRLNQLGLLS